MASSARIDELLKKFDENPRRYFAPLANEYRKAGDLEQAIFICQEYLPQQPGHMSGHIVYGQALYELNRHEEAKAVFETALSLDPENLIALRHLGDIARQAGDTQNARLWYQRVLEADPRNEEIAQIMMSLLSPDAATSPTPAAPAPPVSSSAPTPLTTPAVPVPAANEPPPLPTDHGGFHVEKSVDEALGAPSSVAASAEPPTLPMEAPPPVPAAPTPPPFSASRQTSPKQEELLDLDDFDLGGVPLTELRDAEPPAAASDSVTQVSEDDTAIEFPPLSEQEAAPPAPQAESASVLSDAPAETAETPDTLDLDAVFEADPFAIAATSGTAPSSSSTSHDAASSTTPSAMPEAFESLEAAEPPIERAADLHLGLQDDGLPATSSTPESTSASMDGLETFEAGVFTAPIAEESPSLATESFFDSPEVPPAEAESPPPAEAFVTETMAELYLQQGHLESALDIYRKLVSQRPDDAGLAERMRLLEDRVMGRVPSAAPQIPEPLENAAAASVTPSGESEVPIVTPPRSFGGPTIREFLSGLARRTPSGVGAVGFAREAPTIEATETARVETTVEAPRDELTDEPTSTQNREVDAPHTADEFAATANASRPTPASTETVGESLGALFSGADAANTDTAAANTLSEAFAPDGPETTPLHGVPAHRASKELSLDHVFKGNPSPRVGPEGEGFSFDQFFSDEAAERPADSTTEATPAAAQSTDDIAQFNAWLNGLKKT